MKCLELETTWVAIETHINESQNQIKYISHGIKIINDKGIPLLPVIQICDIIILFNNLLFVMLEIMNKNLRINLFEMNFNSKEKYI